ncbi:hypothetical protein AK830_g9050 [Neonectria ditissima]|uniref:Uncharacterized protein n=1 Tax=Neonectria ditissima TaxID=78410 RepID=A0A0P7B9V2_9HYPO|nr:hypothetical protein AK830_g9050 [Neonectria ditissima]
MNVENFVEAGLTIYIMDIFHHDTPPTPGGKTVAVQDEGVSTLDAPLKDWRLSPRLQVLVQGSVQRLVPESRLQNEQEPRWTERLSVRLWGDSQRCLYMNRQYLDNQICEGSCDGGKCVQKAGYKDVKCSGCPSQTPWMGFDEDPAQSGEVGDYPANNYSLKLDEARGEQPIWQVVKRRLNEEEKQRLVKEAEKKNKSIGIEDDDSEVSVPERFQYYWRLSAPKVYQSAGAIGKHWRPIRLILDDQKREISAGSLEELKENGTLHWIIEDRWQQQRRAKTLGKNKLAILDLNFQATGRFVEQILIDRDPGSSKPKGIKIGEFEELIEAWDGNLALYAQQHATGDTLLEAHRKETLEDATKLPFRYPSGTFVDSRNSIEDLATTETRDHVDDVDRLYVKLLSARAKADVSGGYLGFDKSDVFVLKTAIDKLSGIAAEKDPTRFALETDDESQRWPPDTRGPAPKPEKKMEIEDGPAPELQKTMEIEDDQSMSEEPKEQQSTSKKSKKDQSASEQPRKKGHEPTPSSTIWARNGKGFAFQWTFKGEEGGSETFWNTTRKDSIGSLERETGWTRYIDPKIDLYIVPTSNTVNIHAEVVQAARQLEMTSNSLLVYNSVRKVDASNLPKLRKGGTDQADCDTKMIHLIGRDELKIQGIPMKKLALSPFGHYETWIKQADWELYGETRPDRTPPTYAENKAGIEKAKALLRKNDVDPAAVQKKEGVKAASKKKSTKKRTDVGKMGGKTQKEEKEKTEKEEKEKTEKEQKDKEEKDKTREESERKDTRDWTTIGTAVSATKIIQAVGKREGAQGQATVMGCSATLLAKALGWDKHNAKAEEAGVWPHTSHMPAEWLHRCAFSWGGFDGGPTTSQVKKNLIFGTGECNSVMTRYEKAWQALVRKEGSRLKPRGAKSTHKDGKLIDGGSGLKGSGWLYANIERNVHRPNFGIDVNHDWDEDLEPVPQPMTAADQYEQLPHWLCYALDYRLKPDEAVVPLGNVTEFHTVFYPWQRGFFTKFEQKLDETILESAYASYAKQMKEEVDAAPTGASGHGLEYDNILKKFEDAGLQLADAVKKDEKDGDEEVRKMTKIHRDGQYTDMKDPDDDKNKSLKELLDRNSKLLGTTLFDSLAATPEIKLEPTHRLQVMTLVEEADISPSSPAELSSTSPNLGAVWEQVHSPGPTLIDGLFLADAEVVVGAGTAADKEKKDLDHPVNETEPSLEPVFYSMESNSFQATQAEPAITLPTLAEPDEDHHTSAMMSTKANQEPTGPPQDPTIHTAPERFVIKAKFKLFNQHHAEFLSLQDAARPRVQHYRVKLPTELSMGVFMPPLAGSDLDAIAMRNTTLDYRSHGRIAGLSLATEITLSGLLQPVNALLRDVFKQDRPRINVSTHFGILPPSLCLVQPPQPLGFTLRGELPEVNIPDLFGVLTVTHIGLDVVGTRRGSAGGYDLGYGFFGRGRIDAVTMVDWQISRFGNMWSVRINAASSEWKNVAGIEGVNLTDVFMEAAWIGSKLSTVRLDLRATFSIKEQATLMLEGKLGRNDFEVSGYLTDCSLTTLKQLYNQTFGGDVDVTTEHDIVLSSLVLIVSKSTTSQLSLYGAVSVDGHRAAQALIEIGAGCIGFEGYLEAGFSVGNVDVLEPALAVSVHTSKSTETSRGFEVQFSGRVIVADKHSFDVAVYLSKTSGKVEYTVYGAYDGEFYLHDLMGILKESDLLRDIRMRKLAVCVSNMRNPGLLVKSRPPGYDITTGLTVYAEVDLPVLEDVLGLKRSTSFLVCAAYRPPSEGSSVKIGIRVPDVNAFTIEGFSVGNIRLEVAVVNAQPSIAIGGDLSFPIEDNKSLILGLGLSAGLYEARGEAELKTSWANPFNLNKAVTIHNFKAGLGILYAGAAPSSITLGGAVVVGEVAGSVLVHTGVDASKQLLHINIVNLDVSQLLNSVGSLIDVKLRLPGGSDAFFIRKLEIYLSTGLELFGTYYAQGIYIDADMTLFGKRATLQAEAVKGHVKFKGSVEQFELGYFKVCSASRADRGPYVEMELSDSVQRIKVDGKIFFGQENWIMILINVDTGTSDFKVEFEFVVGDALKIIVEARLDGGLPQAKQDAMQEIEDGQGGKIWQPQQLAGPVNGGLLQGKTLAVSATVEPRIVEYLMKLANDRLGAERNPAEEQTLQDTLDAAKSNLSKATVEFDAVKTAHEAEINKITDNLNKRLDEIKEQARKELALKTEQVANLDKVERDMIMEAAQDDRDLAKKEQSEAAAAEAAAREASVQVEVWRARLCVLEAAENAVQAALDTLDKAETELANVQVVVIRHAQTQPQNGKDDVGYEPWQWTAQELAAKAQVQEAKVRTARANVKPVQDAVVQFDMGSFDEATAQLGHLTDQMNDAEEAAQARRAAVDVNIEAARTKAQEKRAALQKRRSDFIAHADKTIQDLAKKEAAFERERSDTLVAARAKNNAANTDEGKRYKFCTEKHRAADVKLRSYRKLQDSVSSADKILLAPLRFSINVLGKAVRKFLNISSIVIDGQLTDNTGSVTATVLCTVGGFNHTFTLTIELGDIVTFFTELWKEIKRVISGVANELLNLAIKGVNAVAKFIDDIGNGYKEAVNCTVNHFMEGLAEHQDEVQAFLDGIDDDVIGQFGRLGNKVVEEFEKASRDMVGEIGDLGQNVHDTFQRDPRDVIQDLGQGAFTGLVGTGFLLEGGLSLPSAQSATEAPSIDMDQPDDIMRLIAMGQEEAKRHGTQRM